MIRRTNKISSEQESDQQLQEEDQYSTRQKKYTNTENNSKNNININTPDLKELDNSIQENKDILDNNITQNEEQETKSNNPIPIQQDLDISYQKINIIQSEISTKITEIQKQPNENNNEFDYNPDYDQSQSNQGEKNNFDKQSDNNQTDSKIIKNKKDTTSDNNLDKFPYMTLQDVINLPRKIKRSKKVIFDAQDLRYEVIKDVAQVLFQWQLIYQQPMYREDWYIAWVDGHISEDDFKKMLPFQRINHFLGSFHLSKKNYLAQNLLKMQQLLPEAYDFFPKTWTLPQQFEEFKKYSELSKNRKKFYIVKPEGSCQGRGIFLMKRNEAVNPNDHVIIQEYIDNPLLLDELKFDFRIYVLLRSINPLRIYMYPEGLTRLSTTKYQYPTKSNYNNFTMHLTNYAVNKQSSQFQYNESEHKDNQGHKRSLTAVLKEMFDQDIDVNTMYMKIRQIIIKTILSGQPQMSHLYKQAQPKERITNQCFEILGFDIMIDNNLKPWLIEVNHAPSFSTDSPLDLQIKRHLIIDTLNLVNVSTKSRKKYFETKAERISMPIQKLCNPRDGTAIEPDLQDQLNEIHDFEMSHKGAYQLIYPSQDDPINYKRIFDAAKKCHPELNRTKRSLLEPVLPRQRDYYRHQQLKMQQQMAQQQQQQQELQRQQENSMKINSNELRDKVKNNSFSGQKFEYQNYNGISIKNPNIPNFSDYQKETKSIQSNNLVYPNSILVTNNFSNIKRNPSINSKQTQPLSNSHNNQMQNSENLQINTTNNNSNQNSRSQNNYKQNIEGTPNSKQKNNKSFLTLQFSGNNSVTFGKSNQQANSLYQQQQIYLKKREELQEEAYKYNNLKKIPQIHSNTKLYNNVLNSTLYKQSQQQSQNGNYQTSAFNNIGSVMQQNSSKNQTLTNFNIPKKSNNINEIAKIYQQNNIRRKHNNSRNKSNLDQVDINKNKKPFIITNLQLPNVINSQSNFEDTNLQINQNKNRIIKYTRNENNNNKNIQNKEKNIPINSDSAKINSTTTKDTFSQ